MGKAILEADVMKKLLSQVHPELSEDESWTLKAQEEVISRGLTTFFEVGAALLTIRDQRLYRQQYETFSEYCDKRWDITPRRMRQITDGTIVCNTLRDYDRNHGSPFAGRLPENERQVRPLTKFIRNQEKLAEVWSSALEQVPEGKVTGSQVQEAVAAAKEQKDSPQKRYTILEDLERGIKLLKQAKKDLRQHFEYFADQIEQLPFGLLEEGIKRAKKAPTDGAITFGTWEWVDAEVDCISGCSHDCRYCYAKANAIRAGRFSGKNADNWSEEVPLEKLREKVGKKPPRRFMFPTQHDITPANLDLCLNVIREKLQAEDVKRLLIVSKPHQECIEAICSLFRDHRDKILFRFTIGSIDNEILRFWEPNAPTFEERLNCLKHAYENGFGTSVSCEPMLDMNIEAVVKQASPFVTDAFWLGRGNLLCQRVGANCPNDEETINRAKELTAQHNSQFIWDLYHRLKDNPKIKWKESVKKVVGLPVAVEAGTDE